MNSIEETSPDSTKDGTVEITHKTIGPSRPSRIRVASHIKVRDLRNAIAEKGRFPVANLKIILRGKALQDEEDGDDVYVTLKDEDSLIVAIIPKPPVGIENFDDDDDELLLGTGFSIILLNLGKRQPGDVSAYSIFNEDFRELPGTYNAERIDRDIRAGHI